MENKLKSANPIGIFDSGIGGLTVARAVKALMPEEQIIYFGDSAHLPYGDKSTAAIQAYSIKIADVLLAHDCKMILIACNSASAAAYELVKEYVGTKAKVMNVIDPVINYLRESSGNKRIGLIGTQQTVNSNVYKSKVDLLNVNIDLKSLATPLLVPMIEEGFFKEDIRQHIIDEYLNHELLQDIEALILGCTHYPLIKKQVDTHYSGAVNILDSSEIVAAALKAHLEYYNLQNPKRILEDKFMVSDYTSSFKSMTALFFKKKVHLEKYPLWE